MVAGHLQEKKGLFYIVLNYNSADGRRKSKWISTGLTVKGNKKRAEQLLMEARREFKPEAVVINGDLLFADYMERWLLIVRSSIQTVTYSSYVNMVSGVIAPYFREKGITLKALRTIDIQDFYAQQLGRVKASTVIHYHANIHKALKYAVKTELIPTNPADHVERPKIDRFVGSFYDSQEITKLLEAVRGTKLDLPVTLGAFYGLRRSEIIGLKWDAIDFVQNTIAIRHTVVACNLDGKRLIIASDTTKTKSSMRTLPLVPAFREKLLAWKEEQEFNRKLCGKFYCKEYLEYICVDTMGNRLKPGYVTNAFHALLEAHDLRRIRFHDLRHSCASLLLANNIPMKHIQEWLGHSDFSTTANIYAHLDYSSKLTSAQAMVTGLGLDLNPPVAGSETQDIPVR